MSTARCQYAATILRGHTGTEAMLVDATTIVRLECSFHFCFIFIFCCMLVRVQPVASRRLRHLGYGVQNYS